MSYKRNKLLLIIKLCRGYKHEWMGCGDNDEINSFKLCAYSMSFKNNVQCNYFCGGGYGVSIIKSAQQKIIQ